MKSISAKHDLLPVYLGLALAALIAGSAVLFLTNHPWWASTSGVASLFVALPLSGWLAAGPYLEADVVVTLRAWGGRMSRERCAQNYQDFDRLFLRLSRTGVVTLADDVVSLNEDRIRRGLAFWVRLRMK